MFDTDWIINNGYDYFHAEDLPKHPDPKIIEAWEKESEEKKKENEQ